jgi:hypothetical protein
MISLLLIRSPLAPRICADNGRHARLAHTLHHAYPAVCNAELPELRAGYESTVSTLQYSKRRSCIHALRARCQSNRETICAPIERLLLCDVCGRYFIEHHAPANELRAHGRRAGQRHRCTQLLANGRDAWVETIEFQGVAFGDRSEP